MNSQYAIGIDLGTTNCVLAYQELASDTAAVQLMQIPQLVAPGTIENRTNLPSFLYLCHEHESDGSHYDLPWEHGRQDVVGYLARQQAAETPTQTVAAAKSWLCHSKVDRHQPILPWGAPDQVAKVSPVEASRRYLEHLIRAWNHAMPDAPFAEQRIVLTVPASFDASARELTHEAALQAGVPSEMVLLEEPQAAVYAWLADRGEQWRKQLQVGNHVLVCDVGGGTTDLTLVGVAEEEGELVLRRLAVGNHTLVGGDNMDLALAHLAAEQFKSQGTALDAWQSVSLWHACRLAKESLLSHDAPATHPITIQGRGSKLIGGSVSIDLHQDQARSLLLDGFLPFCQLSDRPARRRASGFRELGLPYESDAGITRHLARFLSMNQQIEDQSIQVSHVLFNGGVFKADAFRTRLLEVMGSWYGSDAQPRHLDGSEDLDNAVARGAAYYGFAKEGKGVRIRGGAARSYYVGIETAGMAIPGMPRPLKAMCVVPFGMEEGTASQVPSDELGLVVGEPASFRFFSSAVRREDRPGDLLDQWSEEQLQETDPLEAELPADEDAEDGFVPVRFESRITELGMFELWCRDVNRPERQWKLEFSVREDAEQV